MASAPVLASLWLLAGAFRKERNNHVKKQLSLCTSGSCVSREQKDTQPESPGLGQM